MFKKPTIAALEAKELDDMQRTLLRAEGERDYYEHSIAYCKARIEALEARKQARADTLLSPPAETLRSSFWGTEAYVLPGRKA